MATIENPDGLKGFVVSHGDDWRKSPTFEWSGNAETEGHARALAAAAVDVEHHATWHGVDRAQFDDWVRKVKCEQSDRTFRMDSVRVRQDFAAAGWRASKAVRMAPIHREGGKCLRVDLNWVVAKRLLIHILATDPAFALAAATDGAAAVLRSSAGSGTDLTWTRLLVEGPAIECGPDEDEAQRGVRRQCVLRGEKALPLSNATHVAAIALAKLSTAVGPAEKIEYGTEPPEASATLRAARRTQIAQNALRSAEVAHGWFTDLGLTDIAKSLLEQGRQTARAHGAITERAA